MRTRGIKLYAEKVLGYLPTKISRRDIDLHPGERLIVHDANGTRYMVGTTDDGHLSLLAMGAERLYAHNSSGNVVEILPVPTFAAVRIAETGGDES